MEAADRRCVRLPGAVRASNDVPIGATNAEARMPFGSRNRGLDYEDIYVDDPTKTRSKSGLRNIDRNYFEMLSFVIILRDRSKGTRG